MSIMYRLFFRSRMGVGYYDEVRFGTVRRGAERYAPALVPAYRRA
ncbi:MAG: hypothetical protein AAFZ09_10715 [Pseudomonadota bacterium]